MFLRKKKKKTKGGDSDDEDDEPRRKSVVGKALESLGKKLKYEIHF